MSSDTYTYTSSNLVPSRVEILARLLKEEKITTEEFIILAEKEVQYVQYVPYAQPYNPNPYNPPYEIWCGPGNKGEAYYSGTLNTNSSSK